MKYLKKFDTHEEYEKEEARQNLVLPNVSYCVDENEVHYNPLQRFCKLTLNDDSVVELEGSGELTRAMISSYSATVVSAEIGEACTSINVSAFQNCSGLTSITIGNSVTSLGNYAFYMCSGLTSVTIGSGVTSIGEEAFYNCASLKSVTIGNSVTSIGERAFRSCASLTSVTLSLFYADFWYIFCTFTSSIK